LSRVAAHRHKPEFGGCYFHCRFIENGRSISVDELIKEIQKYTSYMKASGGGVTVSGGEPLYQPRFVAELFKRCKALTRIQSLNRVKFG
jgi:pyruvate-formate lyase-activating enzyme